MLVIAPTIIVTLPMINSDTTNNNGGSSTPSPSLVLHHPVPKISWANIQSLLFWVGVV